MQGDQDAPVEDVATADGRNGSSLGFGKCDEAMLVRCFDALGDPVVVFSLNESCTPGPLLFVNEAACEFFGYDRTGFSSLSIEQLLPPERLVNLVPALSQLKALGSIVTETIVTTRNGACIPMEVNARLISMPSGQAIVCSARDLSRHKMVEETLATVNDNYRAIFELALKGVFQSTLEGRFIKVNPAMASMLGYDSPEQLIVEIVDMGNQLYTSPEERERYLSFLAKTGEARHYETRFRCRDGHEIWVALTARLVRKETDLESYIEGFCEDITSLKEAEAALRESEELHSATLGSLNDTVFITRDDGAIVFISPNTQAMFGCSPQELARVGTIQGILGQSLFDLEQLDAMGDHSSVEIDIHTRQGERRTLLVSVKPVAIRGGTRLYTCRDVTERKLLRAEAMRAAHLASLGELAAGVAHEINNPINGIMLYAELLQDESPDLGENSDVPERIIKQGERVAAIVRSLLSFARKPDRECSPVDVRELINDSLGLTRSSMLRDKVTVAVDVPDDLPRIKARDQEVQQVFVNLLSNARDALNARYATKHPKKHLDISFSLVERDGQGFVRCEFVDYGNGIPQDLRERIFDPFFSTKPKYAGTGLGLSTSHKIVSDLGGRIWFESEMGQYARALVEFPVWDKD